jgi:hypothetical protein
MQPNDCMRATRAKVATLCSVMSLLLLTGSCGSFDESNLSISKQTLSGKIGGQPWSLVTALGYPPSQGTGTPYIIELYPTAFSACQDTPPRGRDANMVTVEFLNSPGNYTLGGKTMYADFGTMEPTRGRLRIDTVTPTTITGGTNLFGNADNTIDGEFQATICP